MNNRKLINHFSKRKRKKEEKALLQICTNFTRFKVKKRNKALNNKILFNHWIGKCAGKEKMAQEDAQPKQ